jgi:hypothetical protein
MGNMEYDFIQPELLSIIKELLGEAQEVIKGNDSKSFYPRKNGPWKMGLCYECIRKVNIGPMISVEGAMW